MKKLMCVIALSSLSLVYAEDVGLDYEEKIAVIEQTEPLQRKSNELRYIRSANFDIEKEYQKSQIKLSEELKKKDNE